MARFGMPMRTFRRSKQARNADEHLTYFTTAGARDFRSLVRQSFAEVGREVTVYADHVEDHAGAKFGLWNIGALCAGEEPRDWPEIIDDHVRRVTTPTQGLDDLTQDEFHEGLYLRLVEAASLPEPEALGYAREVAPGLLEVLSVDLPDTVVTPPEDDLAARGPLEELKARGRENLRSLLTAEDVASQTVDPVDGGRFTVVIGEPFFTASLALLLPEAVERFSGENDQGRGILVAVPNRHSLLYRVVDGSDTALALHHMFQTAIRGFGEQAGPLSANVYWVRNHRWVQVTSTDGDKPQVFLGDGLADALGTSR